MSTAETRSLADEADRYRRENRLPSWEADPASAESSASTLGNSIGEHFGRWLYELFQNAEDAEASICRVRLIENDLLITDSGKGIPHAPAAELRRAVESLSNPFVSTKQGSDNIGRKGIGFCSVYQLTNCPMIWSGGTGIEFSPERTAALLSSDSKLSRLQESSRDLPYLHALLPFGVSRVPPALEAIPREELICGTTVWLPLHESLTEADVLSSFEELDHRFLLTFKWLTAISLEIDGKLVVSITKTPKQFRSSPEDTQCFRLIKCSSGKSIIRQRYAIWNSTERPSKELLAATVPGEKDRKRLEKCDLSVIAAVSPSGVLKRLKQPSRLFVYYPTDETLPLGVIAHGDFILDGSRKHLVDHSEGTLNYWLLDRLASLFIRTANSLIAKDRHAEAFALLKLPSGQLAKDLDALLPAFRTKILDGLLIPKANDSEEITTYAPLKDFIVPDADLKERDLALPLLEDAFPDRLIADSKFCGIEVKSIVHSGDWIDQETLLKRLLSPPIFQEADRRIEWCKAAWQWLAAIFDSTPEPKLSTSLEKLKIVPSSAGLHAPKDDRGLPCLVVDESSVSELPKWIKIDALPKNFSDWIQKADSRIGRIVKALGIQKFSEAAIVYAFERAIHDDDSILPLNFSGYQFINFATHRKWPTRPELEHFDWSSLELGGFAVPILDRGQLRKYQPWAESCKCHFGSGWSNSDLQLVLESDGNILWVDPSLQEYWPQAFTFLSICGTRSYPLLKSEGIDYGKRQAFWKRIQDLIPHDHSTNRSKPEENCLGDKPLLEIFDGIIPASLSVEQASALLRLIKRGWKDYYQAKSKLKTSYSKYTDYVKPEATNIWFQDLLETLQVPALKGALIESGPLGELWVKGYETPDWAWQLFPRLDVAQVSNGDPNFDQWILGSGLVRTRASDIPPRDWTSKIIPSLRKLIADSTDQKPRALAELATQVYRGFLNCFKTGKPPEITQSRVCWKSKKLCLGEKAETLWAVFSEPELELWRDHLPVFLFRKSDAESPAFDALGYNRLDKALTISLEDPSSIGGDVTATNQLQHLAAWLFADRRQLDLAPSMRSWRKVTVHTRNAIRVKLTIEGKSRLDTKSHYFDEADSRLFISQSAWRDARLLATAIVEAFNLPAGYRDRVEILVRLGDEERRARMIEEGILESDLQSWLDQYHGEESLPEAAPITPRISPQPAPTVAPPLGTPMGQGNSRPEDEGEDTPDPVPLHGPEVQPAFPDGFPARPQAPASEPGHREPGAASRPSRRKPPHDALDVEKRSREIVINQLKRIGYRVTEMAQENRGFDLEAKSDSEVLIIEVKGNKDSASEVFLTPAEQEIASHAGNGYRWQLWHVSRLARDSGAQPEIRIYDSIPPAALRPDHYILDLSLCEPIPQEKQATSKIEPSSVVSDL